MGKKREMGMTKRRNRKRLRGGGVMWIDSFIYTGTVQRCIQT